jgi:Sec-independent protein translocase protein TatA
VFGLGMMEIGLIIVIAVMLFPPTELPKLVRSIAKIYGQVRRTAEDFRNTVLQDEDLREPIDEIKGAYNDARWEVRDAERKARQQLAKAQMDMRMATARRLQAEREAEAKAAAAGAEAAGTEAAGTEAARPTPPRPAARAAIAGPVRIAGQDEGEDDADEHGPIAAVDPRLLTAHLGGKAAPAAPTQPKPDDGDQPREGVA